jgi:molybdate transport system substrate-binding protein
MESVMKRSGLCIAVMLLATACGPGEVRPPGGLRVAAASDLAAALPALAEGFKRETGRDVEFVVGASGQLAQQIRQGAPFDMLLSADRKFVERLADEGIVRPDSVRPYARGSLVLVVHRGTKLTDLRELARPDLKHIALANPDIAPYGRAGKQALERAGLWTELEPKIVRAETVRQALQFVQTGNAEAGLVGRAIAGVPEVSVVAIDTALYDPIIQGMGIVARSRNAESAGAFARFLLGDGGQAILARFGFVPPGA